MRLARLAIGFFLTPLCAPNSGAQDPRPSRTLVIQVIDSATHEPIAGAEIHSLQSSSSLITPKTGGVRLASLSPRDTLSVRRLGYNPVLIAAEAIPEKAVVAVALVAIPRVLEDVTIEARVGTALAEVGFFDRRDRLSGFFIGPSQMKQMHPSRTSDIFERAIGVRLSPAGAGGRNVRFARAQDCSPTVFLDGVLLLNEPSVNRTNDSHSGVKRATEGSEIFGLQDHGIDEIGVRDIAAVEAYATSVQAPPEFNTQGANCGVILFWTWNNVMR